jgi:fumarate hydratase, class II
MTHDLQDFVVRRTGVVGIGQDLIPREMITAYATLKKAAANANHAGGRLDDRAHRLIIQACDEILAGQHHDMFPLHVWMTGSGTQFKHERQREILSTDYSRHARLRGPPIEPPQLDGWHLEALTWQQERLT